MPKLFGREIKNSQLLPGSAKKSINITESETPLKEIGKEKLIGLDRQTKSRKRHMHSRTFTVQKTEYSDREGFSA